MMAGELEDFLCFFDCSHDCLEDHDEEDAEIAMEDHKKLVNELLPAKDG